MPTVPSRYVTYPPPTRQPEMSPDEIRQARQSLGLSLSQMAAMLGYEGEYARSQVYRIETGERPLRPCQRRLIRAYLAGYRPDDWPV